MSIRVDGTAQEAAGAMRACGASAYPPCIKTTTLLLIFVAYVAYRTADMTLHG
jgi:hypothetical protein